MKKGCLFISTLGIFLFASNVTAAETLASYHRTDYYPGTEVLAENEMRVIALGTGNPSPRKSQASTSWFIELGNGEKFFFDIGTGSQMNFAPLRVSYRDANKVFLSHLHSDHAGDLAELWIGGWVAGRWDRPLRIWGPSGATAEMGTAHFLTMQKSAWSWDLASRHGKLPAAGAELEINEFDYSKTHEVYQENGVTITSFPALHGPDGPVSYRLDWNGLSLVFSGDTTPTKFMLENAREVDLLVHESIDTVQRIVDLWGWDEKTSTIVGSLIHTQPAAAGRIFSITKPRMAVPFHFYSDLQNEPLVYDEIRSTYDGPLVLGRDGLVLNVTADDIRVRKVVANDDTYPERLDFGIYGKAERAKNTDPSPWLLDSRIKFD
jgi:ribonuclease Z